ncbi:DNA polymerase kappa [Phytophthora palmivora]|uniref:DNA polymerase kappa n=1 Tax=Phytophthora palmivora TaxID=4796 RepID=A0A2P4X3V1_9STRA|nr:DNA polymerase kappa [Phytophthora palmivora]
MFVFTADKAGMKGVDKQHVQEVVHKMSKDSSFYQKSLRDNEKVEQRVVAMREKLACLTGGQLLRLQQEADARVAQMEATRDLSRTIVVVDMDMFYAAVEMRDNPKLRDIPLAVGGLNMISTTNYAARQFGVRAAMPGFIGKELCPQLHFVPVNMEKYAGVAAQIRAVFAEYDPNFEAFSLDEACLDLTDYVANNWRKYVSVVVDEGESKESDDEEQWTSTAAGRAAIAETVVRELRKKIFDCTQLTASAGIAVNAMLAKICSDMNKPNGQYVLPFTRERVMAFIRELPVRKIGGIGKVTEKILNEALDVHTGGQLFAQRGRIFHLFSEKTAEWLLQTSLGVRERREKQERKSFSRERTFGRLSDPKELEAKCLEICRLLAKDLEKANKAAKNVTFVYKDTDFARCSRSMTLASAVFTAEDLYANAVELLRRELPLTLRLMGVRAATLVFRPKCAISSTNSSDEVAAVSKKRQVAINNIFAPSLSTREVDNKPCPICGKLLNARNNMEVNAHMDACVARKQSPSTSPLRRTMHKAPKKSIAHVFTSVQDSTQMPDEDVKPCPICGKLLNTRSNMEVNSHMDACVTQDRSQRTTNKKRSASEISKKKAENSIEVFFRKINND